MTKIQSTLLSGTEKTIEVVNSCIIAKEGPNMVNKMSLDLLEIPYDSVSVNRQTLTANSTAKPILYGWLGTNLTFLLIRPNYEGANPQTCTGTSAFLEYYFEDQPTVKRYLTQLLVLTGDENHRIPQVYLYNPTDYTVTVDIMMGNLDPNEISTAIVPTYDEFSGLAYSAIITDQIYGVGMTGSTQFEILDILGNIQLVIPISQIDVIEIEGSTLTITTNSIDPVKLNFLSNFNASQAISRMNWVMESTINRYLTPTYPSIDTAAPVITFSAVTSVSLSDYGGTITKTDIINKLIVKVEDDRDGIMNKFNVNLVIIDDGTAVQYESITSVGDYSLIFTAKDIAENSVTETKTIIVG